MSTNLDDSATTAVAFQLKGGMYTLTTIQLLTNDLSALQTQLAQKIAQAPNFFHKAPVIIDLKPLNLRSDAPAVDFTALKQITKAHNLILVGLKNTNDTQQAIAMQQGLAILRDTVNVTTKPTLNETVIKQAVTEKIAVKPQETLNNGNKLITTPVRSGQQIYVPDGDLIITSSVSHGAELLADGNIHVYGALRGRALAGINGNKNARIFCSSLEAELVSIAGNFKMSEELEKQAWKIATEVYLENGNLQIRSL